MADSDSEEEQSDEGSAHADATLEAAAALSDDSLDDEADLEQV